MARCQPMSVRSSPRQRRILNTAMQDKWRVLEVDAFLLQKFEQYQIFSQICFYQGDNWYNLIWHFLSTSNVSGLALNWHTHFDAANLDRLNIDGPLHFQTGVLFETPQTFSWSGLRAIAAGLVSRSPLAHRRSDRGHRHVERRDDAHGTPHRLHDVAR